MTPHIFVYGTLRPGEPAFHRWLGGQAVEHRPARLADHALFGVTFRYPFVVPDPGFVVIGDVVTVPGVVIEETLARLDGYEGPEYVRREVAVEPERGDPVQAWTYVAFPDIELPDSERIPSGDWRSRRTSNVER
jgi:gamma-glutamylcyclotransferase (GGCT)/AIG2-like uncharacterized protein YtfP